MNLLKFIAFDATEMMWLIFMKIRVPKLSLVHIVLFFLESVEIKLPHKGLHIRVLVMLRQNFLLKFCNIANNDVIPVVSPVN